MLHSGTGLGDGVTVGVAVGKVIVNDSEQSFTSCAAGLEVGALGATAWSRKL